jgi:TfoX/Sxy family transcriptional regulator of competence genes
MRRADLARADRIPRAPVPTTSKRWITVPYDTEIADRVRIALSGRDHVREVTMFGGLAFMVDERMVVCVSRGDLLVRVAPERDAELLAKPGAQRAEMGKGRSMGEGWITVDKAALQSDDDFQYWMDVSLDFHAQGSAKKTTSSAEKNSLPGS